MGLGIFWGDSAAVRDQLRDVKQIHGSSHAFAAILADRSVVTWGHPACGGDSSAVQHQLSDVLTIQAAGFAFAAVLADGAIVTWGAHDFAGGSVQDQLASF